MLVQGANPGCRGPLGLVREANPKMSLEVTEFCRYFSFFFQQCLGFNCSQCVAARQSDTYTVFTMLVIKIQYEVIGVVALSGWKLQLQIQDVSAVHVKFAKADNLILIKSADRLRINEIEGLMMDLVAGGGLPYTTSSGSMSESL